VSSLKRAKKEDVRRAMKAPSLLPSVYLKRIKHHYQAPLFTILAKATQSARKNRIL